MSHLLSTREVADLAGWSNPDRVRVMRSYLIRRETELGVKFLSGTGKGERLRVALDALRRHCPELFGERTEFERAVKKYTNSIRAEFAAFKEELAQLDCRVAALRAYVDEAIERGAMREDADRKPSTHIRQGRKCQRGAAAS